jgi:mono/diheme cytochrome c family protein
MGYPFWDVGIGYGMLMAGIAVIHVFVSHFAIGGGLYLVVSESAARRAGDTLRLEFLQKLSRFFVLVSVVFGALTGVGIWFVIGLLNPAATEALIHNFVWGWAIEWTFFVVEIAAAIIYYYGWKNMSARNHLIVGWIYFAAAWLSLVVINGIVGFMLTPGRWLETGSFWDGFFNPTYWPQLVLRTGICIVLAGVYAMVVAARYRPDQRGPLVRTNAVWAVVGAIVIVPSYYWYWSAIPDSTIATSIETAWRPIQAIGLAAWFMAGALVLTVLFGLLLPRRMNAFIAVVTMAAALVSFGGFEWMREGIRKPYVIYGYMYGNAAEVAKESTYRADGYLGSIAFRTGDDGADLFRHACQSCHRIEGYGAIAPAFNGTDRDFIAAMVSGADLLSGNMPPFMGTPEEADLVAAYIHERIDQRPFAEIYGLDGVALGERVYRVRCGRCHRAGGQRDNFESLVGLDRGDYEDMLDSGSDYGDGMPDFSGTADERETLLAYLLSLEEGGEQQ